MGKTYFAIKTARGSEPLGEALGDMLLAWTWAERQLVTSFAVMMNCSVYKASRLYQKLPNFRSRIKAMTVLIEIHPEFEPIKALILKLSSLSKTRNDWAHGAFQKGHGEWLVINFDEGLDSKHRSKPAKPHDIRLHADTVRDRADDLKVVLMQLPAYEAWSKVHAAPRLRGADPLDRQQASPLPPRRTRKRGFRQAHNPCGSTT